MQDFIRRFWGFTEITLMLVAVYLVLSHPRGFATVIGSAARSYSGVLRTLQGH